MGFQSKVERNLATYRGTSEKVEAFKVWLNFRNNILQWNPLEDRGRSVYNLTIKESGKRRNLTVVELQEKLMM